MHCRAPTVSLAQVVNSCCRCFPCSARGSQISRPCPQALVQIARLLPGKPCLLTSPARASAALRTAQARRGAPMAGARPAAHSQGRCCRAQPCAPPGHCLPWRLLPPLPPPTLRATRGHSLGLSLGSGCSRPLRHSFIGTVGGRGILSGCDLGRSGEGSSGRIEGGGASRRAHGALRAGRPLAGGLDVCRRSHSCRRLVFCLPPLCAVRALQPLASARLPPHP